jgi:hypothetical protein
MVTVPSERARIRPLSESTRATLESLDAQRNVAVGTPSPHEGRLALTRSVSPGCRVAELGRTVAPCKVQLTESVGVTTSFAVAPHAPTAKGRDAQ